MTSPATTGTLAGRSVHRIGYGAMQLAPHTGAPLDDTRRDAAVSVLRRAVELGVDHIDTAQFYGGGQVNDLIRAALHPYSDGLALVSKVGAVFVGGEGIPLAAAQRPEQLRAQVEQNLAALGVDRLAVVNLRRMDGGPGIRAEGDQIVPIEDQLAELVALRDEGKLEGIGVSNVSLEQLRQALPVGVACVQNAYNVLARQDELVLAECRAHGVAWVPYFPLGSAFDQMPSVRSDATVVAVAERLEVTPTQVGLAWLLAHAPETLLIPGTADAGHLVENLGAADVVLDAAALAELDALAG